MTVRWVFALALLSFLIGCRAANEPSAAAADDSIKDRGCGNGTCAGKETCATCPVDCGACSSCGDGVCNGDETCATCAGDCGTCPPTASCGDGTCNGTETCLTCGGDCGACPPTASCGDGTCNGTETCLTCGGDCGACPPTASCGDGTCNGTETCATCTADCGGCAPAAGRIAFVSDRSGEPRIYLANADGSGVTPLKAGEAPAWSPDGAKLAFHRAGAGAGLYVIGADGAGETLLTAGWNPTWSPDGTKIAFNSGVGSGGGLYVMDADGSNRHLLISHEFASPGWGDYCVCSPAWSPDGRRIAFVRANYEDPWEIYTVSVDGSGGPSQVLDDGVWKGWPAWSPDGSRMAFGTVGMLTDPDTGVRYSADQIASVVVGGSELEVHVTNAAGYVGEPAWSPDGRSLLFSHDSPRGAPTRIFVVREDGSFGQLIPEAQSPVKADYRDADPAWSWSDR